MSDNSGAIEKLLNLPTVVQVTSSVNQELIERRNYLPPVCQVFESGATRLEADSSHVFELHTEARRKLPDIINNPLYAIKAADLDDQALVSRFKAVRRIGVVFSGGPAPGGHNVIAGIFDAAKKANPESQVFGFLMGPDGIIENEVTEITHQMVSDYRNLGGFTMIKTGRTKIDTPDKMALSRETCKSLGIDALVVVGGDDSNTNAAFLAQELMDDGIQVIGVPKTIDGDIQVRDREGRVLCAMSFGFHTAARSFANSIANLCTDSSSDVKYWHICKVMGRVASHLALEVALQTHANITLIGEDLADFVDQERIVKARANQDVDFTAYGMTLRHLSRVICDGIVKRAAAGKNYGVIVIPEGVLEFVNEIQVFIVKMNTIIAHYNSKHDIDFHAAFPKLENKLEYLRRLVRGLEEDLPQSIWNARDDELFKDIPAFFQEGLLMERDSHGNFPFSQVETDKVIMGLVRDYLQILMEQGRFKIGISRAYYIKTLEKSGLNPDQFGTLLFRNFEDGEYLLFNESIISLKTLKQTLVKGGILSADQTVAPAIIKIYQKSVPKFNTQPHFYGYDGRGNDPTRFDCVYTYNLGLTVFSLIAGGITGQMAAIKNLEKSFDQWEPIGIPIAPLMHLEERKGKLALVIEKSVVDTHSPAFQVVKANREKWLAAENSIDHYRRPGPIRFAGKSEEDRPITLVLNALADEIEQL